MTVWPNGLRRWLQAPVRKGVGSSPTGVRFSLEQQQGRAVWGSVGEGRAAPPSSYLAHMALASGNSHDNLAEKALASGASPQGRGLEPHSCRRAHHHHRSPLRLRSRPPQTFEKCYVFIYTPEPLK